MKRRDLLRMTGGLVCAGWSSRQVEAAVRLGQNEDDELCALSAAEAVARMTSGDLSAESYASALLSRAAKRKSLNAFIALEPDKLLEAARNADRHRAAGRLTGLLHGLPLPIKDSVLTADYPTTAGTRAFAPVAPTRDAGIIRRLKEEGALVMGKTNLDELSTGFTSSNEVFGVVRNPWDESRTPGGSSGGTAAAVASGMSPLGVGEDTAGSIRVPAALCGIYGFRPSTGRYPAEGIVPLVGLFDTAGPHARSMRDILLFDAAVTGKQVAVGRLQGARLGVPRAYFYEGVESAASVVIENALVALQEAGAVLVEVDMENAGTLIGETFVPILFHDTWSTLDDWFRTNGMEGGLEAILKAAGSSMQDTYRNVLSPESRDYVQSAVYEKAINVARPALQRNVVDYFEQNRLDAIVVPQTLCTAPLVGGGAELEIDGRTVSVFDALGHNTMLAPSCGMPALTIPAGLAASGLPVGIEIAGLPGNDAALLSLGLGIQEAALG